MKINGTAGADTLYGTEESDVIRGLGGDDVILSDNGGADKLLGGDGNDQIGTNSSGTHLFGEAGDDTIYLYSYGTATGVVADGGDGNDTISLDTSFIDLSRGYVISNFGERFQIRSIESVSVINVVDGGRISGSDEDSVIYVAAKYDDANIVIDGRGGDDTITCESGHATIYGGDGDDSLTAIVNALDAPPAILDGGAGHDFSSLVFLSSYNLVVTLSEDGTTLVSDGGRTVAKLISIEDVEGGVGSDRLTGNSADNTLRGLDASDRLSGGIGDDTLIGGSSRDVLIGGVGADRFTYEYGAFESKPVRSAADVIDDFNKLEHDQIVLDFDADSTVAGRQDFTFIGTAAFSGHAGELRFEQVGGTTLVLADMSGDAKADFMINLTGAIALEAGDFVL